MTPQAEPRLKPLRWIAASKKDLLAMPDEDQAKVLTGFGSAGVLEVVEDVRGSSYRAVYTVKLADAVYVLHCFQKKATKGIATPRHEMEKIRERLKAAEALAMRRTS